MAERRAARASRITVFLVTGSLLGCGTVESKRIEQLLNQKGFGGRVSGDAQIENYVASGDAVQIIVPQGVLAQPGAEGLAILGAPQVVAIDGTIFVPFIGAMPVLGLTERELGTLISDQVQGIYNFGFPVNIKARIVNNAKAFFVIGEFAGALGAPKRRPLPGDYTVLHVVMDNPTTPLGNMGRIKLIRPDPKNPLVVTINIREMMTTGDTTWNLAVKENDIIYAPPTVLGAIARFLERLLLPAQIVVNALFQGLFIRDSYRAVVDDEPYYGGYYGGYGRIY
jgi:hypothetical protein